MGRRGKGRGQERTWPASSMVEQEEDSGAILGVSTYKRLKRPDSDDEDLGKWRTYQRQRLREQLAGPHVLEMLDKLAVGNVVHFRTPKHAGDASRLVTGKVKELRRFPLRNSRRLGCKADLVWKLRSTSLTELQSREHQS